MQNNDLVKNENYIRVSTSSAISSELSVDMQETDKIICASVRVVTLSKEVLNGKAKLLARALFNLIYSTEEGLQNYESGADLEFSFVNENLTEGALLRVEYQVSSVKAQKIQNGVTVSAVLVAEGVFHYSNSQSFVMGVEGAVCKKQTVDCLQALACAQASCEQEGEKVFSQALKRVLYSEPRVIVKEAQCGINEIIVDGEVISELLICLQNDRVVSESLTTPFRFEIECGDAMPEMPALAFAEVANASYKIISEEESEKSVIVANYTLNLCGEVYERVQKTCVCDAFFTQNESILQFGDTTFTQAVESVTANKKCFGEAICEKSNEEKLVSLVNSEINSLNYGFEAGQINISLVIRASLITINEQGEYFSRVAELPVSVVLDAENPPLYLNVTKKWVTVSENENKCFIEGELLIEYVNGETRLEKVVISAEAGEAKPADDSAIGVIFIGEGEDCWSVCKKVGVDEQTLRAQNPNLDFPAEKDCAVVVYKPILE